ncbi:MAG: hypothetical protein WD270_02990 [Acetobacterales bacterium]
MTVRTTRTTVTFTNPFTLGGLDEILPPGTYNVETDEELLGGLSFLAYRRILTLLHLPPGPGHPGLRRTLTVDPGELESALLRDEAAAAASPAGIYVPEQLAGTPDTESTGADRDALDRAEDEGMTVPR